MVDNRSVDRSAFDKEVSDPRVRSQLAALTYREVGNQGALARQAFIETVFNRAAARGQSLSQAMSNRDRNGNFARYYPDVSLRGSTGIHPRHLDDIGRTIDLVHRDGTNVSNLATGNASGTVGFAGGPETFRHGGERFGREGPDRHWTPSYRSGPSVPAQDQPRSMLAKSLMLPDGETTSRMSLGNPVVDEPQQSANPGRNPTPGRQVISISGLTPEQRTSALQSAFDAGNRDMLYIHDDNPRVIARPGEARWQPRDPNKPQFAGPAFANDFIVKNNYPGAVRLPQEEAGPTGAPQSGTPIQPTRMINEDQPQALTPMSQRIAPPQENYRSAMADALRPAPKGGNSFLPDWLGDQQKQLQSYRASVDQPAQPVPPHEPINTPSQPSQTIERPALMSYALGQLNGAQMSPVAERPPLMDHTPIALTTPQETPASQEASPPVPQIGGSASGPSETRALMARALAKPEGWQSNPVGFRFKNGDFMGYGSR